MTKSEGRRKKRYAIPNSTVRYKKGGMLSFLKASSPTYLILNLNELGMNFITKEPLAAGDTLQLTIDVPKTADPITARGTVAWVRKSEKLEAYRIGLTFTSLRGRSRSMLRSLLDNAILENIDLSTRIYLKEVEKL